jgi:hypothetical protein
MKSALFLVLTLGALCLAPSAQANVFETQTIVSVGGPVSSDPGYQPPGYDLVTVRIAQQLRFPKFSSVGLEVSAIPLGGRGVGTSPFIAAIHTKNFRLRAYGPGIFWNIGTPLSAHEIKRAWDVTLGTGVEFKAIDGWSVTWDWRWFLPEPWSILRYGDYSAPAYEDALKGGQLWFGCAHTW